MVKKNKLQIFNDRRVRTVWDDETETWYFSIVDVVGVLTDSKDPKQYIKKMKARDPELNANWGYNLYPTSFGRFGWQETSCNDVGCQRNFPPHPIHSFPKG